jgi:hypothetical protein
MPAPNQYTHNRKWKEEVAEVCSRLCLCAIVPDRWAANSRITTVCPHGVKNTTTVFRLVNRQYCCKSQASKAHDPRVKSRAGRVAWDTKRDEILEKLNKRWADPETRKKQSERMKGVENSWIPTPKQRLLPGTLYLVRYLDDAGTHFKIGITRLTLGRRFHRGQLISIIHLHRATLGECFDLEQSLLSWAKENGHRYSSLTTTELIRPAGVSHILDCLSKQ